MLYEKLFINDFEHMEKDNHVVILGDSIEIMKSMKNNSVNLIFADEPYNIGKNFGNNNDSWNSTSDYIEWNKKWINESMRVLKNNGTMYLMTATQYMPYIDVFIQENYHVLARVIWAYDSSGVQSKKMYGSLYEPILIVTKTSKSEYVFNHAEIMVEAKTGAKKKLMDYRATPPRPYNTKKVPGNIWNFSRVRFKMEEYENHPTQKPEALLERIILGSSNKKDIVFDPFGGSFTTSSVSKKLGRKSISIDLNPEFFKIGIRRLGIANEYKGETILKNKKRKTNNKSKEDHIILIKVFSI
jgi:site-specific DNA-methyltransferase (adenine-specific)